MKNALLITILLTLSLSCAGAEDKRKPLPVVENVDLERYMGTWYEIARMPMFFQRDCGASKAEYELREDGKVNVLNSCRVKGEEGEIDSAKGLAYLPDSNVKSKIKVSFVPIFRRFGWFAGNYWILALDKEHYQYSLVGGPSREYLWILSRRPYLDPSIVKELKSKAKTLGFDISKLKKSPRWD